MKSIILSALGGALLMFGSIASFSPQFRDHVVVFVSIYPDRPACPFVVLPIAFGILLTALGYRYSKS